MSTASVENKVISALNAGYTPYQTEDTTDNGQMGSEEFLTLLVAQLENQNPLDPADTDQFTDQLAQFSQLEQLINLNTKMEQALGTSAGTESASDAMAYVGRQITGTANTMTIEDGSVSTGFFNLEESAQVMVVIRDENGNVVKSLDQGQKEAGAFLVTWDGTDESGEALAQGTYTYSVLANSGAGFKEITPTITGTVDSVVYKNGSPYLAVGGVLLDPASVTSVTEPVDSGTETPVSILEYLGKTITSNYPIVQVEEGQVSGESLGFDLETAQDVTITVYNASNEAVATLDVAAEDTAAGNNQVFWDALADSGHQVSDGLYYYTVKTQNNAFVSTPVTGEVTGIQSVNGVQYLALGDSGRLVSVSTVTAIQ